MFATSTAATCWVGLCSSSRITSSSFCPLIHGIRSAPLSLTVTCNCGSSRWCYYDFYRIRNGKIAEHWDTIEPIPPRTEWKNSNGKFGFSQ